MSQPTTKGARLMPDAVLSASSLLGDKGYDSNWFRKAFDDRRIPPCIPSTGSRKEPIDCDKILYRQRHKIENMVAKLRD